MKFENRVQRYQHLFTKTDKRIVNYIRQNGYSDAFSTINSLAHAIGTSPATMTRFSHKLDYENFQLVNLLITTLSKPLSTNSNQVDIYSLLD